MASPSSYLQQIPGQIKPYYQPYIDAGTGAMSTLQGQYNNLLTDPGAVFNTIGQSFHQSPGFDFAMQQALQGAGHASAAGGMAGSPQHEQQNEQLATNLANQDYYNYMGNVMPLYSEGLHGEEGLMHQGFSATTSLTDQIAQMLSSQAQLAYEKEAASKAAQSGIYGNLLQGASMGAAMKFLPMML